MGFRFFCMPIWSPGSRRKASKCKKLIKQVLYRLKVLQVRKSAIIAQTREDISKLLQIGYFHRASNLVEELYWDTCRTSAYKQITEICECISNNLPCITENSDISVMTLDVQIAVSSLIFAASRCGELPELNKLRNLFRNWYGKEFEAINLTLQPTNLVKSELQQTLSAGAISNDVKIEFIKEITKDYAVIRCHPINGKQVYDGIDEKYSFKEGRVWINDNSSLERHKHAEIVQILTDELKLEEREGSKNEKRLLKHSKKLKPGYTSKKVSHGCNNLNNIKETDASSSESTENIHQLKERDVVYLDDIKETPRPQAYRDYEPDLQYLNSQGIGKRIPLCCDTSACQPLPQEPSKKISNKHMHQRKSTRDYSLAHVHPKLPYFEELEAKFSRFR